ncbi:hypothetical protein V5739_00325 [Salinimicrobium sp. TIG7-5_MAKvit]|uniref:hypothetical protein n=1 Tax=Salinimicrobium sp. TIG7-5_MAKvit TaxID=3121289 RepID=UPI003C6E8FF5
MARRMQRTLDVPIRQELLDYLSMVFKGKNKISHKGVPLKIDYCVYLFYLLETLEAKSFGNINYESRDIHIHSAKLRKEFHSNYNGYIQFIVDHKFLLKTAKYKVGSNTNIYQFTDVYPSSNQYMEYTIWDSTLLKKVNSNNSNKTEDARIRIKHASKIRPHLTKHFNEYLNIDYQSCLELMADMRPIQYRSNFITLFNFHEKRWEFSNNQETDNRLHTLLTRLNKKFLKHITYKNESLAEVDIKTSQPLFLFSVLNAIFSRKDYTGFYYKIQEKLGNEVIQEILKTGINTDELKRFGDVILNHDLYDYIAENLIIEQANGEYLRFEFDPVKNFKEKVHYKSMRDLTKKAVMETLYSSSKNYNSEVQQIKNLFLSVFKIVDLLKTIMKEKNSFPIFLQQIEAEVLLDEVGKHILKHKPDIVLFSKHDSLITTSADVNFLKTEMEDHLKKYLLIDKVKIEMSHWN